MENGSGEVGVRLGMGGHTREPMVDIGIPTHGSPDYLDEAVQSVLHQTFDSWRLTVSENGAGSAEIKAILEPYLADPRVHHVTTGSEISAAKNQSGVLESGDARYVAVLHDDDRWDVDFLARRVAFLENNPTCGLVFSNGRFIDDRGVLLARFTVRCHEGVQRRESFFPELYRHNFVFVPTVLGRRSAYDRIGPAFSSVFFSDYEMWLRMAAQFDVGFLETWDADYRVHSGQTTDREFQRMGEHRLELLDSVDRWLPAGLARREGQRARAGAYLRLAFDAFNQGERKRAAAAVARALRQHPLGPLDWKMMALVVGSLRNRAIQHKAWSHASRRFELARIEEEHSVVLDEASGLSPSRN